MSEIPADITDKAKRIADIAFGEGSFGNVVDAIALALLAERERAAKIAANYAEGLHPASGWSEQEAEWWETGTLDASLAIAAAIRA